jgi:Protein of unknown function (DUF3892)
MRQVARSVCRNYPDGFFGENPDVWPVANACRVTCITRHGNRISEIGCTDSDGKFVKISLETAIQSIELGERVFYVIFDEQAYLLIIGRDNAGNKFLKTVRDDHEYSSLLRLGDCS